ncbi:iron chelate uptake ABC transporter family permease subunit [Paracoccus sp. J56]|uniref:iron chelate uptake ABC transporter family permease subunit n=1 Tax=Paracoccus sp. J56 TaxID=935850 RepID=UPI000A0A0AB8|nr:iron chelate uptake ABC transporter family permease subunit [Paracoccus sp. J56]SMG50812.1 iron complex transport system permease protein [Paracoccus sp. J56]
MTARATFALTAFGLALLALAFVLQGAAADPVWLIPRRLMKLAAMIVGGCAVALSSISFQTVAGNRILTPAVMGYEAVYLLLQSVLVVTLGASGLTLWGGSGGFLLSILFMLGYSLTLDRWLFRDGRADLWMLMLVGLVLTMVIGTVTQFLQLRISPGEFAIFQSAAQISFERVEPWRLIVSTILFCVICLAGWRGLPALDVLALGRDQAMSLGIDHRRAVRRLLMLIAVLVAVSTSLIGPTAFMGIFVANLAYALAPGAGHRLTLPMGCAIAVGMFLLAQLMVERLFDYRTTVGILVNLACGVWFLALMLRQRSMI